MDTNNSKNINTSLPEEESLVKKHFWTVTPLSKYLAMVLFVALPFLGFWIGLRFEKDNFNTISLDTKVDYEPKEVNENLEPQQDIENKDLTQIKTRTKSPVSIRVPYELNTGIEIPEDWKVYTNEEYGFSFKYPDTLRLIEGVDEGKDGVTLNTVGLLGDRFYPKFQVLIDNNTSFGGEKEIVTIDGYHFEKIAVVPAEGAYYQIRGTSLVRIPVLYKSDKFGKIQVRALVFDDDQTLLPVFDNILQSLTYSASAEVPAWNTYSNKELGFEVNVPEIYEVKESGTTVSLGVPSEIRGESRSWRLSGTISVSENTLNATFDDLVNDPKYSLTSFKEDLYIVDGYKALKGQSNEADGTVFLLVLVDDKIYRITQGLTRSEIISSFKFLNPQDS